MKKKAPKKLVLSEQIKALCLELRRTRRALEEVREGLGNLEEVLLITDHDAAPGGQ